MTMTLPAAQDLRINGSLSVRQRALILKLLAERVYDPAWYATLAGSAAFGLDKRRASTVIGHLLGLPKREGVFEAATPKQAGYVQRLLADRVIPEAYERAARDAIEAGTLSRERASEIIDALRSAPERVDKLAFPPGHYALETDDGTAQRYQVKLWRGRAEVTLIFPNNVTERLPRGCREAVEIVEDIAVAWRASAMFYAEITGRCGKCHRLLTDPVSVARRVGPDCAKFWDAWSAE